MNKVDKIFKWISIALLFLIIAPILSLFAYLTKPLEIFMFIIFISSFIAAFLIPVGDLILIVLFFVKLFLKNKTKKDDKQLVLNLISIVFYSYISSFCFAFLFYIFVSDGINS